MKIKTITIENFRSIKNISIDFNKNLNVLAGINGSGKTTILDTVSISLSWLLNRIQRQNSSGNHISDNDVRNDTSHSFIKINITENSKNYNWKLYKVARGKNITERSELNDVTELANLFQESLTKNSTLPVIAYYPVNRVVDKILPMINFRKHPHVLDVYDNALNGKRNYQTFFEWFRLQEDIVNEATTSRTKWIEQNQGYISKKINEIVDNLNNLLQKYDIYKVENPFYNDILKVNEPSYLFHSLFTLFSENKFHNFEKVFDDIENLFHIIEVNIKEEKYSLELDIYYYELIVRILNELNTIHSKFDLKSDEFQIVWKSFIFANTINFWQLNKVKTHQVESEIYKIKFFLRTDKFDSKEIGKKLIKTINQIIKTVSNNENQISNYNGIELKNVAEAIEQFIPEYSSLRVKRIPRPHMLINKGKEEFNLDQLSDGEKNLITLVGDIARRLAIANPNSKEPLKGEGIILIDEIDLHLHPKWQRIMIPQLTKVFPNCQFIITTHSPQVLSHVKPESLFLLKNDKNELTYSNAIESYGMNTDRILEDLLDTDARPSEEKKQLHKLFKLIQDGEIKKAKTAIEKFEYKDDPELVKARVLIKRKELIGK